MIIPQHWSDSSVVKIQGGRYFRGPEFSPQYWYLEHATSCNAGFHGSDTFFWPPQTPAHTWLTHKYK